MKPSPRWRSILILAVISVAIVVAWVALTPRQPVRRAPRYDDPNLLLLDDFSNLDSGWDSYSDLEKTLNYDNGQYVIALDVSGRIVWATPQLDFTDVKFDVDTAYLAGPLNNEYGVMCRYTQQGDKKSFYFFVISSDGYYASGKIIQDVRTILDPDDYAPSTAIKLGSTDVNYLTATCQGSQMSFAINGTPVGAFEDTELTHGDVGLLAGTFDEVGVKIHFDNVEVRRP
jgi:hypothetical protein